MDKRGYSPSPGRTARLSIKVLSVLTAFLMLASVAGPALAFNSGRTPEATGSDTITWTGQGATAGVLDTSQCDATNDPDGANQPYLYWIFTTDGGSASSAKLALGGTGSGTYSAETQNGSTFHFTTPYFTPDPSTLTAVVSFTVDDTGNGAWNLVISHGCAGAPPITKGTLTFVKVITGDNKGPAALGAFTLRYVGPNVLTSGTAVNGDVKTLPYGRYVVSEVTASNPAGYSLVSVSCAPNDPGEVTFTVGPSAQLSSDYPDWTCKVTNSYTPPPPPPSYCIGVQKNGPGGTGSGLLAGAVFELVGPDGSVLQTSQPTDASGTAWFCGVVDGDQVVETVAPPGYVLTPQQVTLPNDCWATTGDNAGILPAPPEDVTNVQYGCTFVDSPITKGTLTFVKVVNGGSAAPGDFTMTYVGPTALSSGTAKNGDVKTLPFSAYTVGEQPVANYSLTSTACVPNGSDATPVSQPILSADNPNWTCTLTNTYNVAPPPPPPPPPAYGYFQFSKTVTGNLTGWAGGAFPFTVTCGGTPQTVDLTVAATGDAVTSQTFGPYVAGTVCSVVEGALPAAGTNANWANSPHYSPSGGSVTIAASQTVSVSVLNTRTYSPATTPPSPKPTGGGVAGATGTPHPKPTLPATTEVPGQGGAPNGTILLLLGMLGAASLALITVTLLRERLLDSVEK